VKARLQSFMEDDDLSIPMKIQDQELDAKLQQKMDSLMKPRPSGPKGVAPEEPNWPSFDQLPSTATFERPSLVEDVTDDEALPEIEDQEECGDEWIIPPHFLGPGGREMAHPQRHARTINGVCVLALENATKVGRKLHVLTVNPKLSEEIKGRVMRVFLEQQQIHEAVTQTAHTNNHQGRRIIATGSLVAGGASIGQTTLDVDTDASNLRKLVAETYNPLYQDNFPALVP
jgi:hypothetical protein